MENPKVTNKRLIDAEEDPRPALPPSAKRHTSVRPSAKKIAVTKVPGKESHNIFTYLDDCVLGFNNFCRSSHHSNFS
jgi:hypothetical protein